MNGRRSMALTDADVKKAEKRMQARMQAQPRAVAARYDRKEARIVVSLSNGLDVGVPVAMAEGLAGAKASQLAAIEITPTGLGLHWPKLDADLHLPSLLQGLLGTRGWMESLLGKRGGRPRKELHV